MREAFLPNILTKHFPCASRRLGKTQIIEFLSTKLNYARPKRPATLKPLKVAAIMHFKLRIIKINATNDLNLL